MGGIPSPNQNYPQQVHVISGDNEIDIEYKYLFDLTNIQNKGTGKISFVINGNDIVMTAITSGTYRYIFKLIDNLTIDNLIQ